MRPPGSLSYPVQAPRQLHDDKLVPECDGHSPIKEQHPGVSVHPQDGYSLKSIKNQQRRCFKANSSACLRSGLHSAAESCYCGCYCALLHLLSAALSFMHESVEPNSWSPEKGGRQASLQEPAPISGPAYEA
ncbi:hypothetical protein NQZ68_001879 [Xyrichtys novacula]|uniref:Uncharacterized protein n=1 Tax=Xyrichtys novacula TaxID=13765 RepID=A0AAV1HEN3_XYRNO|nr:hypothetical protein NQZ68_001879 [Xyrichtys novacula]